MEMVNECVGQVDQKFIEIASGLSDFLKQAGLLVDEVKQEPAETQTNVNEVLVVEVQFYFVFQNKFQNQEAAQRRNARPERINQFQELLIRAQRDERERDRNRWRVGADEPLGFNRRMHERHANIFRAEQLRARQREDQRRRRNRVSF